MGGERVPVVGVETTLPAELQRAIERESGATAAQEDPAPVLDARSAPVLVTGAAGLVGTHVCRELTKRGWSVRALVRDQNKALRRLGHLKVDLVVGDIREADDLDRALRGCGTVIHLAAIAIESGGQLYEAVNAEATERLLAAAAEAGAERFVHMSQNGASSASPYRFLRSKGVAEDRVRSSSRKWTVLRPSVIFGPQDEFVNVLGRLARLTPFFFPLPDGGRARFQPIAAVDVAGVIALVLEKPETIGQIYPLGGPAALTLRQMAERIFLAMHVTRRIVSLPIGLLTPAVGLLQRVLPHPPVTTSLLELLSVDNTVPGNALSEEFGISPTPFAPEEIRWLRDITVRDALRSIFRR